MKNSAVILLGSSLFLACGSQAPTPNPNRTKIITEIPPEQTSAEIEASLLTHFQFDSSLSAEVKTTIQSDLKSLAAWSDSSRADALTDLGKAMGLESVSAQTLSEWLIDRATYFYPATGADVTVGIVKSSIKKIISLAVPGVPTEGVVAANLGPQLYEAYRVNKANGADGLVMSFDGTNVNFLGLRTGVIFLSPSAFAGSTGTDSVKMANSIFRLSALFHEARHSDGNIAAGTHGMLHAACPENGTSPKEYAGLLACDESANGPYMVGAKFIAAVIGLCDSVCTDNEKQQLEAIRLDFISRVLVTDSDANYVDASAEADLTKVDSSSYQTVTP